jgi:hypothetical protein
VTETRFTIGQTVRWNTELTRGWYGGRAADGVGYGQAVQVGRIAQVIQYG